VCMLCNYDVQQVKIMLKNETCNLQSHGQRFLAKKKEDVVQ
jgi:hypothetical protein